MDHFFPNLQPGGPLARPVRRFIVLGHTQRTEAPLPLNDPAGAAGRWDVLARCISNALLVSHGARADSEVVLVLLGSAPPRIVRAEGPLIRNLNPDERSTVALVSRALEGHDVGEHETRNLAGLSTARRTLDRVLSDAARDGPVWLLSESAATTLESWTPASKNSTFVLSDHRDPSAEEVEVIRRHIVGEICLGPVALQADQCIAVVHNRLDRVGA